MYTYLLQNQRYVKNTKIYEKYIKDGKLSSPTMKSTTKVMF